MPILATWDDHDYGTNNKGKTYIKRKESAEIFKDFFNVPKDSIMRTREGVYSSHTFPSDGKMIQIIILDTRYFRDELLINKKIKRDTVIKGVQPHLDPKKTMLGDIQWAWFEKQLEVTADLRIIASSTQIIPHEKGMENWGLFPLQREKLYNLLKKNNVKNTFAISGDVHYSELSKVKIDNYSFYDFTSSGLNRPKESWSQAHNSFRVGKSHAVNNFGFIEIDWKNETIDLSTLNQEGIKIGTHKVKMSELKF